MIRIPRGLHSPPGLSRLIIEDGLPALFLFFSSFNLVELDCFLLSIVLRLFIPFRFFIILPSSELGTLMVTFSRLLCYSGWGL